MVLGRSNVVGIPVALLLMQRNATVTIVHSRTKNMEEVIRRADIVVAAVGKTELVKGSWLKPGAVVIDVGINSKDDPTKKAGKYLYIRYILFTLPYYLTPYIHAYVYVFIYLHRLPSGR